MLKKFVKKFSLIFSVIAFALVSIGLTGCKKDEEIHIDPNYIVNVSKLDYAIKDLDTEEVVQTKTLDAGKEYLLEVQIDYSAGADTYGDVLIDGVFRLYNVSNIIGSIEEANTANTKSDLTFNDDSSEEQCQVTTLTFIVPQVANQVKSMLIKVRLTPNFSSTTTSAKAICKADLRVAMHDANAKFRVGGNFGDGHTFTVYVQRQNLATPNITINDVGEISWEHIENATSYEIYVSGQLLDTVTVTNKYPGEKITYYSLITNLAAAEMPSSEYAINIKAVGSNNYIPATSNDVRYEYISW